MSTLRTIFEKLKPLDYIFTHETAPNCTCPDEPCPIKELNRAYLLKAKTYLSGIDYATLIFQFPWHL